MSSFAWRTGRDESEMLAGPFFGMSSTCPQLGFDVRVLPSVDLDDGARRRLEASFADCLERRGLSRKGRCGAGEWSFIVWREGSQADDLDRAAIRSWAADRPEIGRLTVGLLFDVEHSG